MSTSQTAHASRAAVGSVEAEKDGAGHFRVWVDDPSSFSTDRIQPIRHNFHEHPLMQLPALAKLAKDLSATHQCRFITPGSQQASVFHHDDHDPEGRAIDEVFRTIETPGSWVALYNVETHPVYREFLAEVTATLRSLVDPQQPGMFNVGGFIFISAPPSVTPFHIDRENNFWLQIHGRKVMNVWDHTDRTMVAQEDVESFIVYAGLENVRLKDGGVERSHQFETAPGDGVYFPSTSPHMTKSEPSWVTPGDGVSVSIGVVFYSPHTRFIANVHAANMLLRKLGLQPLEPGRSSWRDALKYPLGRAFIGFNKAFRGYEPKVGLT